MCGSVLGGKWSDLKYAELKARDGGQEWPEASLFFPCYLLV